MLHRLLSCFCDAVMNKPRESLCGGIFLIRLPTWAFRHQSALVRASISVPAASEKYGFPEHSRERGVRGRFNGLLLFATASLLRRFPQLPSDSFRHNINLRRITRFPFLLPLAQLTCYVVPSSSSCFPSCPRSPPRNRRHR